MALFISCGCDWPLNLKLTELTTWFCLLDMSLPHAVCKQIWLLCVFNLVFMLLWSYDIVYITWHLFILCGCTWTLNLKLTELKHAILLPQVVRKQIWRLCELKLNIVMVKWHLYILCGRRWVLNLKLKELNNVVLFTHFILFIPRDF